MFFTAVWYHLDWQVSYEEECNQNLKKCCTEQNIQLLNRIRLNQREMNLREMTWWYSGTGEVNHGLPKVGKTQKQRREVNWSMEKGQTQTGWSAADGISHQGHVHHSSNNKLWGD